MESLNSAQVRKLKGIAQRMDASLHIGKAGLSPGFLATVDTALNDHELVKVKFADFKEEKKKIAPELAAKTSSHLVTLIGNVAVLYRQNPSPEKRKVHP